MFYVALSYSFEKTRSSWIRAFAACVSWLNRLRCFPSESKFCGANHCSYARFTTSQSESSIAYMAVSLNKARPFIALVRVQSNIKRTWSAVLVGP